ncbi:ACP S-malonyltransferase [Chloroflexota bacterium]
MSEQSSVAFIFPGQGAQSVGMGKDLYDSFPSAKIVFDKADDVLGFPLSRMCFEGPEEELNLTINTQPAMLTVSYACIEAIKDTMVSNFPSPAFVAGHSLGEYTTLPVSGVTDFDTAVYLARERGRLMHEAGTNNPGGMMAILGLEEELVTEVCNETDTVIANYNCPGQIVISGAIANLPAAMELAHEKGASRTVTLQVSGAFHSPLMQPAKEGLTEILDKIEFKDPSVPIIANATAKPLITSKQIKEELVEQMCSGVRWQQSVQYMIDNGISAFIEIGYGKVLAGLIRRINRESAIHNIGNAEDIANLSPESMDSD